MCDAWRVWCAASRSRCRSTSTSRPPVNSKRRAFPPPRQRASSTGAARNGSPPATTCRSAHASPARWYGKSPTELPCHKRGLMACSQCADPHEHNEVASSLERLRYFPRQLLTADDMRVEQEYFREKQ